jgi:myo-inositol-1-phosphate synthase
LRSPRVRVALVGVGNCASSLVQGLSYYGRKAANELPPGLMSAELGGYEIGSIEISAAFDISDAKVGRDLSEAIFVRPNNTYRFAEVPSCGVVVQRGATLDGLGLHLRQAVEESVLPAVDVADVLKHTATDVVVSYLPVGSQHASEFYAEQAIEAGCAYVNCIPVFLASNPKWRDRFEKGRVPIIGDDVKSQVGATIVHRALATLFRDRGVTIDRTYQLNFGGNTDFFNMLDHDRLKSKKMSKTGAVNAEMAVPLAPEQIHIGPSDYVPWLDDRKVAYIRVEGCGFGGAPINVELRLDVWDSPNAAAVVMDAIRCAKIGLDRGVAGPLAGPSAYLMKSPPQQFTDHVARENMMRFVRGD